MIEPVLMSDAEPQASAPTLTPERQRLADAIATVAELEAGIAEANKAISDAEEASHVTWRALENAERVLERSKPRTSNFTPHQSPGAYWGTQESYDAHVAQQAEADKPPVPISEARETVARATDDKDSANRMVQFHRDRLKRMQDQLSWKRSSVKDAVRGVIRSDPALLALANEARRLTTRAEAARRAFSQATGGDIMQPGSPFYGYDKPDFKTDFEGWAVSRDWAEAFEKLQTDATTPLPMVGA